MSTHQSTWLRCFWKCYSRFKLRCINRSGGNIHTAIKLISSTVVKHKKICLNKFKNPSPRSFWFWKMSIKTASNSKPKYRWGRSSPSTVLSVPPAFLLKQSIWTELYITTFRYYSSNLNTSNVSSLHTLLSPGVLVLFWKRGAADQVSLQLVT